MVVSATILMRDYQVYTKVETVYKNKDLGMLSNLRVIVMAADKSIIIIIYLTF